MIGLRASPELRSAIEAWANEQQDKPRLSEAVRRLVEIALASAPAPKRAKKAAARASELASATIDSSPIRQPPIEEQAKRKRRRLKGRPNFVKCATICQRKALDGGPNGESKEGAPKGQQARAAKDDRQGEIDRSASAALVIGTNRRMGQQTGRRGITARRHAKIDRARTLSRTCLSCENQHSSCRTLSGERLL